MEKIWKIEKIRHAWPESGPFCIERPYGCAEYVFLHFWDSMRFSMNGEDIISEPHACLLFSPGTPQFFFSDIAIIHDWIHISCTEKTAFSSFGIPENTLVYPKKHGFVTDIVRELELEFYGESVHSRELQDAKLTELFVKLGREIALDSGEITVNERTIALLQSLRRKLVLEYSEDWTVERMAAEIGLSPSYLHAAYKNYYQISPASDLISIRMERARFYLTGTSMTVGDLAQRLGYANTTHFIRQFKKQVGVSPLRYRKNHLAQYRE